MELNIVENEIAPKGKAYLFLREGPMEGLAAVCRVLRQKGARQIFLAYKGPEHQMPGEETVGVRLTHAHDMLGLTRALTPDRPRPAGLLRLEPLSWDRKALFLKIYNDSFFAVPNSATYSDEDFEQMMGPEYRCGFALMDGRAVGIYELGFKKENPEIGSIGLVAEAIGRGLGRELLLTVMDELAALGHAACWLQVSTQNHRAHALYRSVGFGGDEVLGRWYEVTEG